MQIYHVLMTNGIANMIQPVETISLERAVLIATRIHIRHGWWVRSVDGVLIDADVVMPEEVCDAVA